MIGKAGKLSFFAPSFPVDFTYFYLSWLSFDDLYFSLPLLSFLGPFYLSLPALSFLVKPSFLEALYLSLPALSFLAKPSFLEALYFSLPVLSCLVLEFSGSTFALDGVSSLLCFYFPLSTSLLDCRFSLSFDFDRVLSFSLIMSFGYFDGLFGGYLSVSIANSR